MAGEMNVLGNLSFMTNMITKFKDSFYLNFIKDDRWKYITDGLQTTLVLTFFAVLIGCLVHAPPPLFRFFHLQIP